MEIKNKINENYSDGNIAIDIKEDNTGFVYYPDNRIAICISKANNYATKVFCYDNDIFYTLICNIDENGCGFAMCNNSGHECMVPECIGNDYDPYTCDDGIKYCKCFKIENGTINRCSNCKHTKAEHVQGEKIIMTNDRNLITDRVGHITYRWRWDKCRQNANEPPIDPVHIHLNDSMEYIFYSRINQEIKFNCSGIKTTIKCGYQRKDMLVNNNTNKLNTTLNDRYEEFKIKMKVFILI